MQRGKAWLIGFAKAAILAEFVWLVVANLLLGSGLAESLIKRKPEKFSVRWESARSRWMNRAVGQIEPTAARLEGR